MNAWGQPHVGLGMGGMQGGQVAAAGTGMYMQQNQPLPPDAGIFGALPSSQIEHFVGNPTIMGTASSAEQAVDPILRRLCDSTFVPTRDWPMDAVNDIFYVNAVVEQLQQFNGYTSISKLRSALKTRLMSNENIKSVPLKALLVAYPTYFIVKGNQVSLCMGVNK